MCSFVSALPHDKVTPLNFRLLLGSSVLVHTSAQSSSPLAIVHHQTDPHEITTRLAPHVFSCFVSAARQPFSNGDVKKNASRLTTTARPKAYSPKNSAAFAPRDQQWIRCSSCADCKNSDELGEPPCTCASSISGKHMTPSTERCCRWCSHASAYQGRC